ncbi:Uncharacterised protein [Mycobacteroides abscessus subsp. abscessus]|nr:Uncharacterised protein [Mycobacteroides abscessus subsp. abscessus]
MTPEELRELAEQLDRIADGYPQTHAGDSWYLLGQASGLRMAARTMGSNDVA